MKSSKYNFKEYNNEIYAKTKKYQKIYGFEIGTGSHDAWNNKADATTQIKEKIMKILYIKSD